MARKSLFLLLFLILALIASLFLVFRTTIFSGRATTIPSSAVLENSYLFASPIQAKADGHQIIRITVFLLNSQGLGVNNQKVTLTHANNLNLKNTQNTSDDYGKTIFDISSSIAGKYTISAQTNQKTIPQSVNIVFY